MTGTHRRRAWWPITADRIALSLTGRSTIHASAANPLDVSRLAHDGVTAIRTVCGSDAFVIAHSTQQPGTMIVAPWPPPKLDRCPDCERILGKRLPAAGAHHWQTLTPTVRP